MGIRGSNRTMTDGLVLYLDAANPKSYIPGSTVWNNLSKSNIGGGNLINGVGYTPNNAGSLVFDGMNDYITIPSILLGKTDFSISMWVRCDLARVPNNQLVNYIAGNNSGGSYIRVFLEQPGTTITGGFQVYCSGPNILASSYFPIGVDVNRWGYFSFSKSSTFLRTFCNGILLSNLTINDTVGLSTDFIQIGRYSTIYYHTGLISNYMVYNRALTTQEIQQNFNATRGRYGL